MSYATRYLIALAAVIAAASWILLSVESSLEDDSSLDTPAMIMENFLATLTDAQGRRNYTLSAPYLVLLPGDQGTELRTPVVEVFQGQPDYDWQIRAETAWVAPDGDLIRLNQAVTLDRPATAANRPVTITTRDVRFYTRERRVETDRPVRLTTPGGVVDAVGLHADLNSKRLQLNSEVRGYYEPPPG